MVSSMNRLLSDKVDPERDHAVQAGLTGHRRSRLSLDVQNDSWKKNKVSTETHLSSVSDARVVKSKITK